MTSRVRFDPLDHDAMTVLTEETGIDFRHVDFTGPQWLCASARDDDGAVQGVLVAEFTTWFEVHLTTAVRDRRCVTRHVLRAFFTALFSQATRVTAQVRPDNRLGISGVRRLGFVYEGYMRRAIEGQWDALLFGMIREECPWLPGYVPRPRPDAGLNLMPSETLQ